MTSAPSTKSLLLMNMLDLIILGMFGGMALTAFIANLVRLPSWARERERQLQTVAEHAVRLLSKP